MASSLNDMWPVSKTLIPFKVLFLYGYQIHESPLNNQRYAKVTWSTRTLCVFVTRFSQSFFDNNFALRLLAKFCLHIPSSPPLAVIQFSMSRDKLYKMSMTAGFFFTTLNAGNIILKKNAVWCKTFNYFSSLHTFTHIKSCRNIFTETHYGMISQHTPQNVGHEIVKKCRDVCNGKF